MIDRTYFDKRDLNTAIEAIYANEDVKPQSERNAEEIARITAKWACVLGDEMRLEDGTKIRMKPVPQRIGVNNVWPMMAQLLENQALKNPMPRSFYEATTTSNVSLPMFQTLPVIREIFPALFVLKIASVQPMPPSSGGKATAFWWKTYRADADPVTQRTIADSGYALSGERQVPKRMSAALTSQLITAITDKLAATWTTELEEDLLGVMGIDINSEMLQAMAGEMLHELEQRVLTEISNGASAGNVIWDAKLRTGHTEWESHETLFHAILDAQKNVMTKRHRDTNYIMGGISATTYLLKSQRFVGTGSHEVGPVSSGVRLEGTYNGKWDVYSSPYLPDDELIVSYYPQSMLHAGYIYMPYVPIMPMPKQYADMRPYDDEDLPGAYVNTDSWTQNVRTRYGKYLCEPDMFAKVIITDTTED